MSDVLRLPDQVLSNEPIRLLSKFTISTHMHQQVRIFEAKLEGGTGLEIKPCRPASRRAVVVGISSRARILL